MIVPAVLPALLPVLLAYAWLSGLCTSRVQNQPCLLVLAVFFTSFAVRCICSGEQWFLNQMGRISYFLESEGSS